MRSGEIIRGTGWIANILRYFSRWHYFYTIEANVSEGQKLLEFGCGAGDAFIPSRFQTTGVDIDFRAANSAQSSYQEAVNADVRQLPFKANNFDAAASSFVIEHLALSGANDALSEIYRVLRPGGVFICLCDLECSHPMVAILRRLSQEGYHEAFLKVPGHLGLRHERTWAEILGRTGFEILSWRLISRFPLLDYAPWIYLASSPRLPKYVRRLGQIAHRLSRVGKIGSLWVLGVTVLDDVFRPFFPQTWAYRLLFAARKRSG